jgi:hypothetical protein
MVKYEIKKFPIVATVIVLLSLIAAVIATTISLFNLSYDGTVSLALLEIVAAVLLLAGITTGKVTLLRVISIIMTVCTLLTSFILAIVKYEMRDIVLFGVALFMLIASVLELVYFLTLRNPKIEKFYLLTSIVLTALVVAYAGIYIVTDITNYVNEAGDLNPHLYAVLVSFACITILPMLVYRSIEKVELPDPVKESSEENVIAQEEQANPEQEENAQ